MNQSASKGGPVSKTYKRTFHIAMIICAIVYAVVLVVSVFLTKYGQSSA